MPTFEYQAQRSDGSTERGVVISGSLDGAARDLAAKGVQVTQIGLASSASDPLSAVAVAPRPDSWQNRPTKAPTSSPYEYGAHSNEQARSEELGPRNYVATSIAGPLVGKVPLANISFFFRQAGTMLEAAVPIVQALNTLAGQARNAKLAAVLQEVARNSEAGRPMSAVLQRYPEVFTPVMLSMVRAGEEGGFLDRALFMTADYVDQEIALRNIYRKATFWPKVELAASVVVILGANAIIDSVRKDAQHLSSPLTTLATWVWLGPLVAAIFLFFRVGLANPRVKYNWDMAIGLVPFLGKTLHQISMARFGRAFGALYRSGVPMQRALTLSADACGNEYLRTKMYPAYEKLQGGHGLTKTLEETHAFSPIVLDMVRTGETTGNLDSMLNRMSDFYIGEAEVRQNQLAIVVGIFVTLCVAIYIGYIVISFWTGYYSAPGYSSAG